MINDNLQHSVVVKLGGSTMAGRAYQSWLSALQQSQRPVVIVPGGGPFADTVRDTQSAIDFNDATAHDLALLSMHQFGRVLLQHLPSARPLLVDGKVITPLSVWLPDPDELVQHTAIEQSWRTTGDALACWLCVHLNVTTLVLIKSVETPLLNKPLPALTKSGIIDPLCESWIRDHALQVHLLGANDQSSLVELLR